MRDRTADFQRYATKGRKFKAEQPKTRDAFHRGAGAVHLAVRQAVDFVHSGLSDATDVFQQQARIVLKRCGEQVDSLKGIVDDVIEADDEAQDHYVAHMKGVLSFLYTRLEDIAGTLERVKITRAKTESLGSSEAWKPARLRLDAHVPVVVGSEDATLEQENQMLENGLQTLGDAVLETEKRLRSVAELHQMFATRVLAQTADIDALYDAAVSATVHAKRAGEHIRKATSGGADFRIAVITLLVFASLSLLFLDWLKN